MRTVRAGVPDSYLWAGLPARRDNPAVWRERARDGSAEDDQNGRHDAVRCGPPGEPGETIDGQTAPSWARSASRARVGRGLSGNWFSVKIRGVGHGGVE